MAVESDTEFGDSSTLGDSSTEGGGALLVGTFNYYPVSNLIDKN